METVLSLLRRGVLGPVPLWAPGLALLFVILCMFPWDLPANRLQARVTAGSQTHIVVVALLGRPIDLLDAAFRNAQCL